MILELFKPLRTSCKFNIIVGFNLFFQQYKWTLVLAMIFIVLRGICFYSWSLIQVIGCFSMSDIDPPQAFMKSLPSVRGSSKAHPLTTFVIFVLVVQDHSYGGLTHAWVASNNHHWFFSFVILITFNSIFRSIIWHALLLTTLEDFVCWGKMNRATEG